MVTWICCHIYWHKIFPQPGGLEVRTWRVCSWGIGQKVLQFFCERVSWGMSSKLQRTETATMKEAVMFWEVTFKWTWQHHASGIIPSSPHVFSYLHRGRHALNPGSSTIPENQRWTSWSLRIPITFHTFESYCVSELSGEGSHMQNGKVFFTLRENTNRKGTSHPLCGKSVEHLHSLLTWQ